MSRLPLLFKLFLIWYYLCNFVFSKTICLVNFRLTTHSYNFWVELCKYELYIYKIYIYIKRIQKKMIFISYTKIVSTSYYPKMLLHVF